MTTYECLYRVVCNDANGVDLLAEDGRFLARIHERSLGPVLIQALNVAAAVKMSEQTNEALFTEAAKLCEAINNTDAIWLVNQHGDRLLDVSRRS